MEPVSFYIITLKNPGYRLILSYIIANCNDPGTIDKLLSQLFNAGIVRKYRTRTTSTDYPEYVAYRQRKEKATATEFSDAFVDCHSDRIGKFKKLVSYISEHRSVEKPTDRSCSVRSMT